MHTPRQSRASQSHRQCRRAWFRVALAGVCLSFAGPAFAKGAKKKSAEAPAEETASADEGPLCFTYANMKDATAGVLQIPVNALNDGSSARGFDGYPVVIKLANDRARVCRIDAKLKLADKLIGTYEVIPAQRVSNCLLLLELSTKTAILRDRRGQCGPALCGEMELNGFTMTFDPKRATCAPRPAEADAAPATESR